MSKSDFDKLKTFVFFSFVYVALVYVIWNFITVPAVIHFGDEIAARAALSYSFDEVLAQMFIVNLLFAATKIGSKKEAK